MSFWQQKNYSALNASDFLCVASGRNVIAAATHKNSLSSREKIKLKVLFSPHDGRSAFEIDESLFKSTIAYTYLVPVSPYFSKKLRIKMMSLFCFIFWKICTFVLDLTRSVLLSMCSYNWLKLACSLVKNSVCRWRSSKIDTVGLLYCCIASFPTWTTEGVTSYLMPEIKDQWWYGMP